MGIKKYNVIGLMSGTSIDGLDIAYCNFKNVNGVWSFRLIAYENISYKYDLKKKLHDIYHGFGPEFKKIDTKLGDLFGNQVDMFISSKNIVKREVDFIVSHGHTVLHRPSESYTLQIGNGNNIKARTGITTVFDLRSMDVALGGQGAPLVPIGDELLFGEYDYCINIGGIANTSYNENGVRKAFDISFANMALNPLANELNLPFDKDGSIAKRNDVNRELLDELLKVDLNKMSLSTETYLKHIEPLIQNCNDSVENKIATLTEYTARKIAKTIKPGKNVLVTGGGAFNTYLIGRIKELTPAEIIIPSDEIVEFKEAIIFAFLGVLKMENIPNCLASVTGASRDSVGGVVV